MFNFLAKQLFNETVVKQQVFQIPVLIKKEKTSYCSYSTTERWTEYVEAITNGFFYEKDCVKYFRVCLADKKEFFIKESDLVFLTDGSTCV